MLLDIVTLQNGFDIGVQQTEAPRAGNILATQLASLEYAPDFGIDMQYFLESEIKFQNESFKAYLVQRLLQHHVNVVNVIEVLETLYARYAFGIGSSETGGGLIS